MDIFIRKNIKYSQRIIIWRDLTNTDLTIKIFLPLFTHYDILMVLYMRTQYYAELPRLGCLHNKWYNFKFMIQLPSHYTTYNNEIFIGHNECNWQVLCTLCLTVLFALTRTDEALPASVHTACRRHTGPCTPLNQLLASMIRVRTHRMATIWLLHFIIESLVYALLWSLVSKYRLAVCHLHLYSNWCEYWSVLLVW